MGPGVTSHLSDERPLRLVGAPPSRQLISSPALGMLMFVLAEGMMFAGLISAFTISEAAAPGGWPPIGQPRLPVEETAFNTVALLASGAALFLAQRRYRRLRRTARMPLLVSILLGGFFVLFQGFEWWALIREGLTLTSNTHGSFFYLIVGMHAAHALGGLVFLLYAWLQLARRLLEPGAFAAAQILWYFVVGLWPILYGLVYL